MAETPHDIERPYRLLIEHLTDYAVFMTDPEGRVSSWNEGAQRILGYSKNEIFGHPADVIFTQEDRDRGVPQAELTTATREGRATDERWHLRKDGSRFFASGVLTAVRNDTGNLIGFAKVLRDVTERKLADARLTTQHAVSRVLAKAPTLADALPAILEAVCRSSEWQCGQMWAVDEPANRLRWVQAWRDPSWPADAFEHASEQTALAPGVGLPGRVWATDAPAWIADVAGDENFPRRAAAVEAGLHGAVAFPVRSGEELLGVMEFFCRAARPPEPPLRDMMAVIGRQIGQFIRRRRAEEAVVRTEARTAAILNAALDCIVSMDHDGRVTEWNPAAEKTFGYSRTEALGREMADLIIPPSLRQSHREGLANYLVTGEGPVIGRRIEITAVRKDQTEFPVELTITRVALPGPPAFTGHLRDISERKRSEGDLAEARRELERKVEERTRELAEANAATLLEREFLTAVLESAEDGIVACDADGTLRLFNAATRRFHGLPEAPLPPEQWAEHYDLYLPDGTTPMTTEHVPLFRALRDGEVRDVEMVIAPKGGTARHLTASGRAILDANGAKIGAVVVMHDLTDRRLAEARRVDEARRMSEHRFQRLVEHSPMSTQLFWPDGRTRQVNAAFTRLFGITLDELHDYNILHDPQLVAVGIMPLMKRAFAGEAVVIDPIPYVPDRGEYVGQTRWAGAHVYPVKDSAGLVEEVVLVHHDVTEQKQAERGLQAAKSEAESSLARWRAVVVGMAEGVVVADATGNLLEWNPAALEMHGYTSLEEVRRHLNEFTAVVELSTADGQSVPLAEWPMSRVLRGETFSKYEVNIRRLDADLRRVISYNGSPVRDRDGNLTLAVLTLHDVTEERRAQSAVRESEAQFRQLAETIPQLAWMAQPDGFIFWYNRRWYDYTGTTPQQMEGWGWQDVHDPAELPRVLERWKASITTGEPFDMEFPLRRADGQFRWFLTRVAPLRDSDGRIMMWFGTNTDIEDRRRIAEERAELLERERAARGEAERQSRMKDEFLATLGHELRTPLNAILGWSQIIKGSPSETDVAEGVEVIARNARAQQTIIEDLLEMSRIISGKVRLDVQRLEIAAVIEAAVETVRHAADAKGVRIQVLLDPVAGPINGDPNRLQQVFWNLLSNAVKFSGRGSRIQVVLERVNSHVEVSVIDAGEGISPEFLPHVFDRFRQADGSTTRRHGGLGLGLSIVKQLVELHGGTVRAKSPGEGQGATFTVMLPLTAVHPEPEPVATRRHPRSGADVNAVEDCVRLKGVKVLVVDDEADARALVKRLLEDCEAVVTTAGSAAEAMEALRGGVPDVLLSDIGMPQEDGFSLIRRIRTLPPADGGQVPAVALTAYARSEDRTRAMLAGFQSHVAKPVEPSELVATVASLAALNRARPRE